MAREAKATVVASVWGADFVQFLAALVVLPRSVWKKRLNSPYSVPLSCQKNGFGNPILKWIYL